MADLLAHTINLGGQKRLKFGLICMQLSRFTANVLETNQDIKIQKQT